MAVAPLSRQEIEEQLARLPGWTFEDDRITRAYTFDGHLRAAALVGEIARVQEGLGHHSDLTLGYDKVTVSVTTHSADGRVTSLDLELARRIEAIDRS